MRGLRWPLVVLAAVVTALLLVGGCGGDDDDDGGGGGGEFDTRTEGVLLVGSDIPYPPFEFGREPNYRGLDIDVVREVARRLDLEARFVKRPFDTIFRNLAQGRFDMVASATTITPEREREVDFSSPYFPADQSLMVRRGSDIRTVDDLEGAVVGAQLGTTGADYAKDNTDAETVRTYDLIDDAFNALESGQVEAVINDCPVSKYAERSHRNLRVVRAIPTDERYGFAFASDSDELRTAFNRELAEIREDGTLEEITRRWLGDDPCAGLEGTSD